MIQEARRIDYCRREYFHAIKAGISRNYNNYNKKNIQPASAEISIQKPKTNSRKYLAISYAEAVAKATLKSEHIRNINLMGTPEENSKVSTALRKDD